MKKTKQKRKHLTDEQKKKLLARVAKYQAAGKLTMEEISAKVKVSENTLYKWKSQFTVGLQSVDTKVTSKKGAFKRTRKYKKRLKAGLSVATVDGLADCELTSGSKVLKFKISPTALDGVIQNFLRD